VRPIGLVAFVSGLALAVPAAARAQATVHGFAQFNSAVRATGPECPPEMACDVMRGEERVQLKLDLLSPGGRAGALARVDLFHGAIRDDLGTDVREAYVDVGTRPISARLGRQVVTWGLGDLLCMGQFEQNSGVFLVARYEL